MTRETPTNSKNKQRYVDSDDEKECFVNENDFNLKIEKLKKDHEA